MPGALGVRAEPAAIHWALVHGTSDCPILHAHGSEVAPNAYGEGESLAWIRQKVLYILDTYNPTDVGIRYPERTAKGANKDSAKSRCRVEGVVLEAAASRNLRTVTGALASFGRYCGSSSPTGDLDSENLRGLDWSQFKARNIREAIFVAASLLAKG